MSTNTPPTTEAAAVADIVQRSSNEAPIQRDYEDATLLIWPKNQKIESLERFSPFPRRKRATANFHDPESLCAYVAMHGTSRTILLGIASEKGGAFRAILDYHQPVAAYEKPEIDAAVLDSAAVGVTLTDAGWGEHCAVYTLENSPEWARWIAKSGTEQTQRDFALFIEDNALDIFVPEIGGEGFPNAAKMSQIALNLQARTEMDFSSAIRLNNGEVKLNYTEKINATVGGDGSTVVPELFAVSIAPFKGCVRYQVIVRLRYRLSSGRLFFTFELQRPHKTVEHAFGELRALISKTTGRPVLQGSVDLSKVGG